MAWSIAGCVEDDFQPFLSAPEETVVASWDGGAVALVDLEAKLSRQLREMDVQYRVERYELIHSALDKTVEESLLEAERGRRGLATVAALIEREVDQRTPEPTTEELQVEFERFVTTVPESTFELTKPYLADQIRRVNREARYEEFLAQLRAEAQLHVNYAYPDIPRIDMPVRDHDPFLGSSDAAVTIVEFGEYHCYFCARAAPVLEKLVETYPDAVRVVFKDFPLAAHDCANRAAIAAHCAGRQGRYWEMGRLLMDNQGRPKEEQLRRFADQLGLDLDQWDDCTRDPTWQETIDDDLRVGREAGVVSTPTFFVNGLMVQGAQTYERFVALVEQEQALARRAEGSR
jgi:protein-disulfide isomerase